MDTKELVEKRKAFIEVLLQELNGGTIFVNEAEQVQKLIRNIKSKNFDMLMEAPEKEAEFWGVIAECEWTKDFDYKRIKRSLMEKYTVEYMLPFNYWFDKKQSALGKAIEAHEEEHGRGKFPYSGDDGWSDMLAHVMGSGQKYYEAVIADPSILYTLNVKESFSYAVPSSYDYERKK
jgi:hypothetical protein